jgi:alanine dehydrogenase
LKPQGTLLLSRKDVEALMPFPEYLRVVEEAFRLHAEGKTLAPAMMHFNAEDGEFHIKAGGLRRDRCYFALKANGGFFHNRERFGMPNIQGAILLADGENGYPLAVMDSGEITRKRTSAAAAVAAKYLAKPESSVVTICGYGVQAREQLRAMHALFRLERAYVWGGNLIKAETFAREFSEALNVPVIATESLERAVGESDICVTCTPARQFYLPRDYVRPGTFIAAIGADSPEKQELDPGLLRASKVVVDVLEQCARAGELHHALALGMLAKDVHAELGEVIARRKPGRTSRDEVFVFDSTGTALQDVAAAAAVYERALARQSGTTFDFYR